MSCTSVRSLVLLALHALAVPAFAGEDVEVVNNWAAPPYSAAVNARKHASSALAAPAPLQWVGVIPCRVADTRGNGFTGSYGPPALQGSALRDFQITGQCGIPTGAKAVSFNFTVAAYGPGFLIVWEAGIPLPNTSTLVFAPAGQFSSNAIVVALSTGGRISVAAGVSDADVIIDVNGYYTDLYAPNGVVTSVNSLSGDVTLAAGSNVTITPAGNTLTIAATPGGGGPPSGPAGGGLSGTYPNPTVVSSSPNTPNSIVSRDGTGSFEAGSVGVSGALTFRRPLVDCWKPLMVLDDGGGGSPHFMKACGSDTFLGTYAGYNNPAGSGVSNTGFGVSALSDNIKGSFNSALGASALWKNTGFNNTAVGAAAMAYNTNGSNNTAVGFGALELQSYDSGGPNWFSGNTAVGANALIFNAPTSTSNGMHNTAVGAGSLSSNTTGSKNSALGLGAGSQTGTGTGYAGPITYVPTATGDGNTFVGWGTGATSATVSNCTAVGKDAYCDADNEVRLGNASVTSIGGKVAWSTLSDARAKTDVRDLALGLDFVLSLRPVAYTLKRGNGRTDMGFLAQDVEALLGRGYNVVTAGGDPDRTLSLRYTDLIAPLVKAIQEQQALLDAKSARVDELERRLAALEERSRPRAEESRP